MMRRPVRDNGKLKMSLDLYFAVEIQQGITSTAIAILSTAIAHNGGNVEYVRGALDFARAQALNYGLPWAEMLEQLRVGIESSTLLDRLVEK